MIFCPVLSKQTKAEPIEFDCLWLQNMMILSCFPIAVRENWLNPLATIDFSEEAMCVILILLHFLSPPSFVGILFRQREESNYFKTRMIRRANL